MLFISFKITFQEVYKELPCQQTEGCQILLADLRSDLECFHGQGSKCSLYDWKSHSIVLIYTLTCDLEVKGRSDFSLEL